mgnify:CR=1 FL=1
MRITLCRQEMPNPLPNDNRGSDTSIMTHLSISLIEDLDLGNIDPDPDADLCADFDPDQDSLSPRYLQVYQSMSPSFRRPLERIHLAQDLNLNLCQKMIHLTQGPDLD